MGLLTADVIRNRTIICTQCVYWTNMDRCAKGHIITSALGCPIKSFPPSSGAGYAENREPAVITSQCKTCHSFNAIETIASLAQTVNTWKNSGFEMSTPQESERRLNLCKSCDNYDDGRCEICHCYMTLKTKLKTAECPKKAW
jgi:hypothetical protein